jgi:tRNA nucleotidyltransferase/poly(A) polymerase
MNDNNLNKFYLTGGCVRDELLGVPSKDYDFVVLVSSFEEMREEIKRNGGEIFLEKPEFQVIRAKFPNYGAADFALPRKDGTYTDGRRPDTTEIAQTLLEDSRRRDFTINAMYKNISTNEIVDYHNGRLDLEDKIIRTVGNMEDRFSEDFLRPVRAIRFHITKDMKLNSDILTFLRSPIFIENVSNVSHERIREEMYKCFKSHSLKTLILLENLPEFRNFLFDSNKFWLNFGIVSK